MSQERDCPICGANPCYGICPNNDPFMGNQAAEEAEYSFNAQYDRFDGFGDPDMDMRSQAEDAYYSRLHQQVDPTLAEYLADCEEEEDPDDDDLIIEDELTDEERIQEESRGDVPF